jgi:predicted HTH transcriptional regulator
VYEGRPLHETGWEDLKAFLEEGRPEGTRLDYKRKWGQDVVRDAFAMANTSGGALILGVKEVEDRRAKTHAPDTTDILGEDSSKDWKTIVEGKVRGAPDRP